MQKTCAIVVSTRTALKCGAIATLTVLAGTALANPTMQFAILGNNQIFQGFLDALQSKSLLKTLAQPKLVTTSGRPASLLSGGEFPILVPQGLGTATISWRQSEAHSGIQLVSADGTDTIFQLSHGANGVWTTFLRLEGVAPATSKNPTANLR